MSDRQTDRPIDVRVCLSVCLLLLLLLLLCTVQNILALLWLGWYADAAAVDPLLIPFLFFLFFLIRDEKEGTNERRRTETISLYTRRQRVLMAVGREGCWFEGLETNKPPSVSTVAIRQEEKRQQQTAKESKRRAEGQVFPTVTNRKRFGLHSSIRSYSYF